MEGHNLREVHPYKKTCGKETTKKKESENMEQEEKVGLIKILVTYSSQMPATRGKQIITNLEEAKTTVRKEKVVLIKKFSYLLYSGDNKKRHLNSSFLDKPFFAVTIECTCPYSFSDK